MILQDSSHDSTTFRLHADRTAGRHRHYCDLDRATAAGGAKVRGGGPDELPEQPQATRAGPPQLRRVRREAPHTLPIYRTCPNSTVQDYKYTWSVLAQLNPYLEQTNIYSTMDLSQMMYVPPTFQISTANQFAVVQKVKLFLCPSDRGEPVSSAYGVQNMGPTNYVACHGSGVLNNGSPLNADGVFIPQFAVRITDITDGTSNTAAMSESILGAGGENVPGTSASPGDERTVYKYLGYTGTLPSDTTCAGTPMLWNGSNHRQFMWASGGRSRQLQPLLHSQQSQLRLHRQQPISAGVRRGRLQSGTQSTFRRSEPAARRWQRPIRPRFGPIADVAEPWQRNGGEVVGDFDPCLQRDWLQFRRASLLFGCGSFCRRDGGSRDGGDAARPNPRSRFGDRAAAGGPEASTESLLPPRTSGPLSSAPPSVCRSAG